MTSFAPPTDTIQHAAALLRAGETTSRALVERCLAAINQREAEVHAWVFVDGPGALQQAEHCDAELHAGADRGPLHGMPLAIKDIIDVAGWPTAAGSTLWKNRVAAEDAFVVRRLRQAGAILLGKTVTTQFASFDPPITANPCNLTCTPGGSSSGSAAAVASGMCYAALGSQTGGSITRPAAYCGVAGCKPTYGRVSVAGILPLAQSMDHPGPIARTVQDLALVLDAIAGPDAQDPTSSPRPYLPIGAIRSLRQAPRIGLLRAHFELLAEPVVRSSVEFTVERLRQAGASVCEVRLPGAFRDVIRSHRIIMAVEAAAWHEDRLHEHPADYQPRIRELLEEGLAARAVDYRRAREHQSVLGQAMLTCFEGVDALLAPATTDPAPPRDTTGDPVFNSPWSFVGLPVVSFPVAWTPEGLPLSVQLAGLPFAEMELFRVASWCETRVQAE